MKTLSKIPDSELEIMMVIWDANMSVTSDYIMDRLDKDWAKPTLLNLLSRLCERGFVECTKDGRINVYTAKVKKDDYLELESKNFLKKMHHNSLTSLVASLYSGDGVTKDDLEELKKFIEEAE